ncbi:dehydrogenase/reductase SDR family member on chromosome X isoform X1 [Tachysurus ichikawai]
MEKIRAVDLSRLTRALLGLVRPRQSPPLECAAGPAEAGPTSTEPTNTEGKPNPPEGLTWRGDGFTYLGVFLGDEVTHTEELGAGHRKSQRQTGKRKMDSTRIFTPAEGASTAVYAAAASELEGLGGMYLYNGQKKISSASSYDKQLQEKLWTKSCAMVGLQEA